MLFPAGSTVEAATIDVEVLFAFMCALDNWKRLYSLNFEKNRYINLVALYLYCTSVSVETIYEAFCELF